MPIQLYPKCWRDRDDCKPIHCIDGTDRELTEEEYINFDYTPASFVCSGFISKKDREIEQDAYRLCFKNSCVDEMTDNDMQDLTSVMSVCSMALCYDACVKHSNGIVETPAEHTKNETDN